MKKENKMIAEFMGWTFHKREDGNYDITKDGVESWDVVTDADFKSGATYSGCFSYVEWNDIIPVVKKIDDLFGDDDDVDDMINRVHNAVLQFESTNVVHKAVVEFIKFYNKSKK